MAKNPILREDELLNKLKPRRKKEKDAADLDPFAPGQCIWGQGPSSVWGGGGTQL